MGPFCASGVESRGGLGHVTEHTEQGTGDSIRRCALGGAGEPQRRGVARAGESGAYAGCGLLSGSPPGGRRSAACALPPRPHALPAGPRVPPPPRRRADRRRVYLEAGTRAAARGPDPHSLRPRPCYPPPPPPPEPGSHRPQPRALRKMAGGGAVPGGAARWGTGRAREAARGASLVSLPEPAFARVTFLNLAPGTGRPNSRRPAASPPRFPAGGRCSPRAPGHRVTRRRAGRRPGDTAAAGGGALARTCVLTLRGSRASGPGL
jgi:hypothetical protein